MSTDNQHSTSFGFRTVDSGAKTGMIRDLFASVANRYDVMNDAMSLGAHRIWKSAMIDWLAPRPGQKILDLAGGTGDIAVRILRRSARTDLTVVDLTEEMIRAGQRRAKNVSLGESIQWVAADALKMPFVDRSFDRCTIAFGIRNFADIDAALREIRRILKPGGRLMILEFSDLRHVGLRGIYDKYSFHCIPALGSLLAHDRDSYRYLVESIRRFPDQRTFANLIGNAGFDHVKFRNLSMGIAALHSAWKL